MDDFDYSPPESLSILLAGTRVSWRHRGLEPGKLVRCLRRGARISHRVIAARAGMRQARVSDIEREGSKARWGEIAALMDAIGCVPVLLAVSARYPTRPPDARPLARRRKFRYTEPPCSRA